MQLWAAIDLLEGAVVTLTRGRASERTVWKDEPLPIAEKWEAEGAHGLHLVDLDAAFQRGSNRETILRIIKKAKVPVEVGGGIRTAEAVGEWLAAGAERVIVGTMAYRDPALLSVLLHRYGTGRIVVAADYKEGVIVTKGWTQSQGITLNEAVKGLEARGVKYVLTTSVGRDGTGSGPDVETIARLCNSTKMSVIASGGIRDPRDIEELEKAGARAAVLGRALYEGGVEMSQIARSD